MYNHTICSWNIQPFFVQDSLKPILSFAKAAIVQSMLSIFQTRACIRSCSQKKLQKVGLFSRCKIFWKNAQDTAILKCMFQHCIPFSCKKCILLLLICLSSSKAAVLRNKYGRCLERVYINSIGVELFLEEVHVQSGDVLFWKALMNSMKRCRTLFGKCIICTRELHSCQFNIKYSFGRNIDYGDKSEKSSQCVK